VGHGRVTHHGWGGADRSRLDDWAVVGAGGIGSERAVSINADGLWLWRSRLGDAGWRSASVSERVVESVANSGDIGVSNTKGSGRESDIVDEPADLAVVQGHELVGLVHVGRAGVLHGGVGELAAAEQVSEVGVQVGEEDVLCRVGVVGRHVHHQRLRTTSVEEVDRDTRAATIVGGGQRSGEVRKQVYALIVAGTRGQKTRNRNANVWLGVVADGGGIDDEGQQRLLVRRIVLLEECSGVVVADGRAQK